MLRERPLGVVRGGRTRSRDAEEGVRRGQVADLQRARMLSAVFEIARERGAGSVTVGSVVERSGVSRRTFYEAFGDREDCFLEAFDEAVAFAARRVLPAYETQTGWCARLRSALGELLSFLDEEPAIGHLLILGSLGGGAATLKRRANVVERVTGVIDLGRQEKASAYSAPPFTSEGIVGGALAVIQGRLTEEPNSPLTDLANPLMGMIVLPYLGQAAARRELQRPVKRARGPQERTPLLTDPFKDTGLRLTYRTVRVLMVIHEHSGASNRQIGEQAGIADQGQISKLLARLERARMISNTGLGPGLGAPNEWALTPTGERVVSSIRTHTENPRHEATASSENANQTAL